MKKVIKNTLIFSTVTIILGGLSLLANLKEVFEINILSIISNNLPWSIWLIVLAYFLLVFIFFGLSLTKQYLSISNIISDIKLNKNRLHELEKQNQVLKNQLNVYAMEIQELKTSRGYHNPNNIHAQRDAVKIVIHNIQELQKDLKQIIRYDNIKPKHRTSYQYYQEQYHDNINIFEDYYMKFLTDRNYKYTNGLRDTFEKSSVEELRNSIITKDEYSFLNQSIAFQQVDKWLNRIIQPVKKYEGYLENVT